MLKKRPTSLRLGCWNIDDEASLSPVANLTYGKVGAKFGQTEFVAVDTAIREVQDAELSLSSMSDQSWRWGLDVSTPTTKPATSSNYC